MNQRHAYLIMPVSHDPLFISKRAILEEVARDAGVDLHFPMDRLPHYPHGTVDLDRVLDDIAASTIVLADLSLERPSCYYELGLAEAMRANVVILAAVGTDIHQAASRSKVEFYRDLREYKALLRKHFKTILTPRSSSV